MYAALKMIDGWGEYGSSSRQHRRYDDTSLSAFVENELKDIVPTMYNRLYPELDAREKVPIDVDVSPGAMAWAYDSMEQRGKAKIMGANAHDMPRADIGKRRVTNPIRTQVLAYGWTIEEIEAARFAGSPLDRGKADATRRGQAELEHEILLLGDATYNLPGFLTNPATPRITVPTGDWLGGVTTPDEILVDLNTVVDLVWILSERVHRPTSIVLPLGHIRHLFTTPRSATSDTTIAEFFLRTNGFVNELTSLPELETLSPTGGPTFLAYQKDPSIVSGVIPLGFQQMDAQVMGFETLIPTRQKIGGTVWFYPMAAAFGDGI